MVVPGFKILKQTLTRAWRQTQLDLLNSVVCKKANITHVLCCQLSPPLSAYNGFQGGVGFDEVTVGFSKNTTD